jgi:hypothetical protein
LLLAGCDAAKERPDGFGGPAQGDQTPAQVPYLYDGALHVGSTVIPTDADYILRAGGTTLVATATSKPLSYRWSLLDEGDLVPLRQIPARAGIRLSGDGLKIAWSVVHRHFSDLVVLDVASMDITGVHRVEVDALRLDSERGGASIVAVDEQGRVFWAALQVPGMMMWDPQAGADVEVTGQPGGSPFPTWVGAVGFFYEVNDGPVGPSRSDVVYGDFDESGRFHEITRLPGYGVFSPDGRYVASRVTPRFGVLDPPLDGGADFAVIDVSSGDHVGVDLEWVRSLDFAWESATSLIAVAHGDGLARLYRCEAPDWSCVQLIGLDESKSPVRIASYG